MSRGLWLSWWIERKPILTFSESLVTMRRKSEKTQSNNHREASEAGLPDVSPVAGREEGGEAIAVPSLRQEPGGVQQRAGEAGLS